MTLPLPCGGWTHWTMPCSRTTASSTLTSPPYAPGSPTGRAEAAAPASSHPRRRPVSHDRCFWTRSAVLLHNPTRNSDLGPGPRRGEPDQARSSATQHLTLPPPFFSSDSSTGTGTYPAAANFDASPLASQLSTTCRPSLTAFSPNASASASSASTASGNSCRSTRCDDGENAPG